MSMDNLLTLDIVDDLDNNTNSLDIINNLDIGNGIIPPLVGDPLLAIYPPIGDLNYNNFKFFQVNKGEFITPQTDFIWEITGSVGPGIFQEASGFDIRPFLNNDPLLEYEVPSVNVTTGNFTIKVKVPTIEDLEFVQIAVGNPAATDDSTSFAAIFSGNELDVSAQSIFPRPLSLSTDGFTLLVGDQLSPKVFQYDLSIANDLSTAIFSGNELDVSAQVTFFGGMTTSSDGFTLLAVDQVFNKVFQYNMTVANDLSTGSFSGNELDVSAQSTTSGCVDTSTDGFTLLLGDQTFNKIFQYNMTVADDLSTASFSGNELDVSAQDTNQLGLSLSTDGFTFVTTGGLSNKSVFQYNMTTSDDLSTASFSGNELNVSAQSTFPSGLAYATDGFTFVMSGGIKIFQYNMTVPNSLDPGTVLSTFETRLLTKGEKNFLVDEQGRNIVAVQS